VKSEEEIEALTPANRTDWEEKYAKNTSETYPMRDKFMITIVSSATDEQELKE